MTAVTGTDVLPGPPRAARGAGPTPIEQQLGVTDTLVFERADDRFRLVGGTGRGAGWAGIVDVAIEEEPHLARAWRTGAPVRVRGRGAVRVAGPYWSSHAVVVPVGQEHVVVLGSDRDISLSDTAAVRTAARIASETGGPTAEKLLADELELVHAIRSLMAYRPVTVRDTLRHVATISANALACEYVAVRAEYDGQTFVQAFRADRGDDAAGPDAGPFLADASQAGRAILEQGASDMPRVFTGSVVSRLTLPLGQDVRLGVLSLGHATEAPRGFTLLCQRIGSALAEAAELLITQAFARERLAAERDLLQRLNRTDALTGLGNRVAWGEAADACRGACPDDGGWIVISADLDGLKAVNDRHGHLAGDAVIRAAGHLLRAAIREEDLVARVGGDEFLVLCRGADEAAARAITRRIARARRVWRTADLALIPLMSVGWAPVVGGDVDAAVEIADARMYAAKRRRTRRRQESRPDRRRAGT